MIAVDTSILVYAHRVDLHWHGAARAGLEELSAGTATWAVPMHCLHEFLATVTRRGPLAEPTPVRIALRQIDALLDCDNLIVLIEDGEHWRTLETLIEAGEVSGGAVHDARIAASCLRHGVSEFWTADRDFSRFPALRTRNPLIAVNEPRPGYRLRTSTSRLRGRKA